jgi:hypothetical protein
MIHAPLQASPFDEQVPPSRVPYSVSIPVWSSLDGQLQPIEVLMEVIPDVISNLSRVDTAVGPLNHRRGLGLQLFGVRIVSRHVCERAERGVLRACTRQVRKCVGRR